MCGKQPSGTLLVDAALVSADCVTCNAVTPFALAVVSGTIPSGTATCVRSSVAVIIIISGLALGSGVAVIIT